VTGVSRIARYDDWRATRFFPGLEGLRAVAALLVVFHHARTHRLWGALEGWNGVTLFFVLSGPLITTLALREEDEHGALRWRAFVVRRGFRILPVYLASLALYVSVMLSVGFGGSHRAVFAHALPWYLSPFPEVPFFTRTHIVFSLAWSLGIEEKFYLLWPLVASSCCASTHEGGSGLRSYSRWRRSFRSRSRAEAGRSPRTARSSSAACSRSRSTTAARSTSWRVSARRSGSASPSHCSSRHRR